MKYKAIGFDYGGVIAGLLSHNYMDNLAKICHVSLTIFLNSYHKFNSLMNEQNKSWADIMKMVLDDLKCPEHLEEVLRASSLESVGWYTPNVKMLDLIKRLKTSGYCVGLLSNATSAIGTYITKKLCNYFDAIVISGDIGLSKPDPEAFYYLFDKLKVTPNEAIFIDDSKNSLSTAVEVGYMPILFTDYQSLIKDLNKLGVDV